MNLVLLLRMYTVDWESKKMIELLTADTPNGKKISIMLEEISFEYKVTKIKLNPEGDFLKG